MAAHLASEAEVPGSNPAYHTIVYTRVVFVSTLPPVWLVPTSVYLIKY